MPSSVPASELTVDCEELPGQAYLDPDLWERIVLNLVSNAFKVTLSGEINVGLRAIPGGFTLSVGDTGPGIAPLEQARVFERFYRVQTTNARSHEGAGIGLALVKELVEMHGGEITLQSVVGEGSTFTVTVPLGREHLPSDQIINEPVAVAPGIADLFAEEAMSWLPADDDGWVGPRRDGSDEPAEIGPWPSRHLRLSRADRRRQPGSPTVPDEAALALLAC